MILIDAAGLVASRPGRVLFEDLDLTVTDGDRLAVVGINGTGKSTLLGVLAGTIEPEAGAVRRGRGVEVAVLAQDPRLEGATLGEALHAGLSHNTWEVESVADRLGLGGELDTETAALSGGQRKRGALARALVSDAKVLVLDEPTNHLDIDAIDWLEERLAAHSGALLMVTHDRHFLDRVCTRILELDKGEAYLHDGGYASYLEARSQRVVAAESAEARRANLARRELAWLRRGAPARTSKAKARVTSATELVNHRVEADVRAGDLPLHSMTPRLGDRVIELHGVGHAFGDRVLFEEVELLLDRRERLGVVGPNGSGKSTLLDIMAARLEPGEGTVEQGSTVRVGIYDQQGRDLDNSMRVREAVAGPGVEPDWTHKALMDAFWFDADAQRARVGNLSGGERRRLQLLVTLAEKPNVLLLDEPTNDLDTETLRQLEDYLEGFPGAVVVVSHDRAFLERVVTDVVVLGDGRVVRRPGGYAAYEAERRAMRAAGKAHGVSARSGGPKASSGGSGRAADPAADTRDRGQHKGPSPSTLRHRLRTAERNTEAARSRCMALRESLETSRDHGELAELGASLAAAESDLAAAEEAWLAVADEIESRGLEV
jgi:ATP-binding cassette subfamily F protein uup